MNKKILLGVGLLVAGLLVVVGVVNLFVNPPLGGAPQGVASFVATSSNVLVGLHIESLLYEGSQSGVGVQRKCASRIVTTRAEPIVINFSGTSLQTATTTILSTFEGHLQGASTTVVYDSAVYGCGFWGARSVGVASTTVTISESE